MSLDLRHDGPTLVGRVPILTGMRNVRGMPQVAFIEEISAFVQDHNVPLDEILQALSTIHRCAQKGGACRRSVYACYLAAGLPDAARAGAL